MWLKSNYSKWLNKYRFGYCSISKSMFSYNISENFNYNSVYWKKSNDCSGIYFICG